jgi:CheY-like chemotaxis protein
MLTIWDFCSLLPAVNLYPSNQISLIEGDCMKQLMDIENRECGGEEMIRVVLVNSQEAMRTGLRQMLSQDEVIRVVGEERDGRKAGDLISLSPDVVIMDLEMRGVDGFQTIRSLKESSNKTSVIVLSDNRNLLPLAIEAGAVGFLTRRISRSELIAAIRSISLWRWVLFDGGESHFALVRL